MKPLPAKGSLVLGIDAGGTYTDVAVVERRTGRVVASAKSETLPGRISLSISRSLKELTRGDVGDLLCSVAYVHLATTFATNAIAEENFRPVALLALGYPERLAFKVSHELKGVTQKVVFLGGGHDFYGNPRKELDEQGVLREIARLKDEVEVFAVSGFYSVRNPAHEQRVRELIRRWSKCPVVCAYQLSSGLNSLKRAVTATLNGALVPVLQDLLVSVAASLREMAVRAPLMVVRGDGTLMSLEWAMMHPIETILSGPAASAMGAFRLAGEIGGDCTVVDMGGTTTDFAKIREGRLVVCDEGAHVGNYRTMVKAVDVTSIALGGDSLVEPASEGELQIGPRRVLPLFRAFDDLDDAEAFFDHLEPTERRLLVRRESPRVLSRHDDEKLLHALGAPLLAYSVGLQLLETPERAEKAIVSLRRSGALEVAAWTPSDALVLAGRTEGRDASLLRRFAERLAASFGCRSAEELASTTIASVSRLLAERLVVRELEIAGIGGSEINRPLLHRLAAFLLDSSADVDFEMEARLTSPLVCVGAPIAHFLDVLESRLAASIVVPESYPVAGAVGAAVGDLCMSQSIFISLSEDKKTYRAHLPLGTKDYAHLDEAVKESIKTMTAYLRSLALDQGLSDAVVLHQVREDAITLEETVKVYFGTEINFQISPSA